MIIIDEISMMSFKLLLKIHKQFYEIFGTVDKAAAAEKRILIWGDLYQLPPAIAKPVFSDKGSVKRLHHYDTFSN